MDDQTPVTVDGNVLPPNWDMHKIAAFVRDVAVNLYPIETILKKHGLAPDQYAALKDNDFFKRALEAALIEWNSPQSTQKRLAMEAAIALEEAMPVLAARMHKSTESLRDLGEVAKLFAKMSGVGEDTQHTAPSEKFAIIINLGGDKEVFDKNRVLTAQAEPAKPVALIEGSMNAGTTDSSV